MIISKLTYYTCSGKSANHDAELRIKILLSSLQSPVSSLLLQSILFLFITCDNMDISLTSSRSQFSPPFFQSSFSPHLSFESNAFTSLRFPFNLRSPSTISLLSRQKLRVIKASQRSSSSSKQARDDGFVLEDVPHLTHFLPDLQVLIFFIFVVLS